MKSVALIALLLSFLQTPAWSQAVGAAFVDLESIELVVQKACIDTAPSFKGFSKAMRSLGFKRRPSGIWGHPKGSISTSVKKSAAGTRECKVIFQTNASLNQLKKLHRQMSGENYSDAEVIYNGLYVSPTFNGAPGRFLMMPLDQDKKAYSFQVHVLGR
jgi:hypothetical protein